MKDESRLRMAWSHSLQEGGQVDEDAGIKAQPTIDQFTKLVHRQTQTLLSYTHDPLHTQPSIIVLNTTFLPYPLG
ncbi:hypothetical protein Pcinc_028830 [Petrolisthes cinctipes]|uniref:Uncharacterized protein n=1 Tax=Petrolisthes cinctipes TaxID=88211 RepID=A0AAE1F185_PETCI|nr:hypothetical protein Pcinc_028830 [Petrolisthes cinctipes]